MNANSPCILCATDFSERAGKAATVAAKLAVRGNTILLLVHVVERPTAAAWNSGRTKLEAEVKRLTAIGAVVDHLLLQSPWPARALLKAVRTRQPGLIVVAAAVKGSIDRWAFGSVSEQVAESAPVATLVIRDPAPFASWDWTGTRLKLFVGLDLYATSDVVLRWTKELRQLGPCDVVSAYANLRPPAGPAEPDGSLRLPVNPPVLQERLEREMRKKVRDHLGDDGAEVIVKPIWGQPESWLIETAHETKPDLIVVGTHRRTGLSRLFHGSVSRALLRTPHVNVVTVPVTAEFSGRDAHIPEFRRVLVATDFSELGNVAVPYACGLCSIGGLVRIVHVKAPGRGDEKARAGPLKDLCRRLRDLVPHEIGARARPPEVDVLEGRDPAAAICLEAERFGADAVCISSHGLGGSHALFGSVTKAVLKEIRRPVLIVRRPDE